MVLLLLKYHRQKTRVPNSHYIPFVSKKPDQHHICECDIANAGRAHESRCRLQLPAYAFHKLNIFKNRALPFEDKRGTIKKKRWAAQLGGLACAGLHKDVPSAFQFANGRHYYFTASPERYGKYVYRGIRAGTSGTGTEKAGGRWAR